MRELQEKINDSAVNANELRRNYEEQQSYVESLEASLKKRQGIEDRLHLVESEFRTTVS